MQTCILKCFIDWMIDGSISINIHSKIFGWYNKDTLFRYHERTQNKFQNLYQIPLITSIRYVSIFQWNALIDTRPRLIMNQGTEDLFQPWFQQSTDVVCVFKSNSFTIALQHYFVDIWHCLKAFLLTGSFFTLRAYTFLLLLLFLFCFVTEYVSSISPSKNILNGL